MKEIAEKAENQERAANEGADEEVQEYGSIAASGLPKGADAASVLLDNGSTSPSLFGNDKGDGKKPAVGQALEAAVRFFENVLDAMCGYGVTFEGSWRMRVCFGMRLCLCQFIIACCAYVCMCILLKHAYCDDRGYCCGPW